MTNTIMNNGAINLFFIVGDFLFHNVEKNPNKALKPWH
jgi:hypothetical protein